jgi:hypothetical protein
MHEIKNENGGKMKTENYTCLVCKQSSQEIPLLMIEYQDRQYWICPQHLPILIHKPEQLVGKLPGAENLHGGEH